MTLKRLLVEIRMLMTASDKSKESEEHYGENLNHYRESRNHQEMTASSCLDVKGISGGVPEGCGEYVIGNWRKKSTLLI